MGKIVGAWGVCHDPLITAIRELAEPRQIEKVDAAFDELKKRVEKVSPDALIVIGDDHFNTFFLDNMPAFCIGVAAGAKAPVEGWLRIPKYDVTYQQDLAKRILNDCVESEIDLSWSEELKMDHGIMLPLHFMTPHMKIPIVPLYINCQVHPMPTPKRCYEVGKKIREIVEAAPGNERIGVIGTGGLSHWVGTPETGKVNVDFDHRFLDGLLQGKDEELTRHTNAQIEEAGNGAHEIRNWLMMLGAAGEKRNPEVICYEPIPIWITGVGFVDMNVPMH